MHAVKALTLREIGAFWYSPIAYIIGGVFALLQGWVLWTLLVILSQPGSQPVLELTRNFFMNPVAFFCTIIMIPLITMRSFSEEKRSGSFELLITAPVTDFQIVLSKFLGALAVFALLWLGACLYLVALYAIIPFDWRVAFSGYLGILLYGAILISIGNLASSLTRNQIIAGFLTLMVIVLSFSLGWAGIFTNDPQNLEFFERININVHLMEFSKGFISTQAFVLAGTIIAGVLLITTQIIESPRFRS